MKNAKPEPVQVKVLESVPADWRMLSESQPRARECANVAVWHVRVPAEGAATLSWQVKVRR